MSKRVIDHLRKHVPGHWHYSYAGGSEWQHESGLTIRAAAAMDPRFDGDDEHFVTTYWRTDTWERVFPSLGIGLEKR